MALIEIKMPPGLHDHGTDLESRGRWRDANLVRWTENTLAPIRGWRERTVSGDALTDSPRGMLAWQDNNASRWIAAGTYNKLYAVTSGGVVDDITPVGFTAGDEDASVNTGYGGGTYGTSFYGQPRPDDGNYGEVATWSMDTWGEYLVACAHSDGKLYQWTLSGAATQISNSPTSCSGVITSNERFLFAIGAGGDPRKVQWSDQEDNTVWAAATTNQAGSQILDTPGQVMAAKKMAGQVVFITDTDAHRATYAGPPLVYQFERVGTSCGAISRTAAVGTDRGVFWMGFNSFFMFDGSQVRAIPCEISDRVFLDLNEQQRTKIWGMTVGEHDEVWWFYPSADGGGECDKYAAYNIKGGFWTAGSMDRTSGVDRGVFAQPLMSGDDGKVYDHETGYNYDSATVFAESGPAYQGSGDRTIVAKKLYPDERTQGDCTVTFKTRLYPNAAESSFGPYSLANPTSIRLQGRQIRMRVEGARQTDWRIGNMRVDVSEGSRR